MIIIFARNARMLFQRNCLRRVEQDHLPMEESIIVIAMTKVIREINREFKKTTTATATRTSLNKRFNE